MHRIAAWGLLFALAPPAFAADPAPAEPPKRPWYARLVGSSDKKPDPEKENTFAEAVPRPPVVIAPLDPSVLTDALRAEQEALSRRIAVCLKVQQAALAVNDEALFEEAERVKQQAEALYFQRAARLGVKAPARVTSADPIGIALPPAAEPTPFREVKP